MIHSAALDQILVELVKHVVRLVRRLLRNQSSVGMTAVVQHVLARMCFSDTPRSGYCLDNNIDALGVTSNIMHDELFPVSTSLPTIHGVVLLVLGIVRFGSSKLMSTMNVTVSIVLSKEPPPKYQSLRLLTDDVIGYIWMEGGGRGLVRSKNKKRVDRRAGLLDNRFFQPDRPEHKQAPLSMRVTDLIAWEASWFACLEGHIRPP